MKEKYQQQSIFNIFTFVPNLFNKSLNETFATFLPVLRIIFPMSNTASSREIIFKCSDQG